MPLAGSAVRSLVGLHTWPSYRRFLRATEEPERAQREVWREIAPLLRQSELWCGTFRPELAQYDITTLEFYQPAIARSLRTGWSALNGEPVLFWSQSAGTTGDQKLFPMTRSFRRQFQRTVPPMVHGLVARYPRFLSHPALYFAATDPRERTHSGIDIGFISNYNYRTVPALMRSRYAFPTGIFRDPATFERYAPVYALQGDLSAMFAVTPMSIQHLVSGIRAQRDFIIASLRGTGPWDPALPRPSVSPGRLATVTRQLEADDLSFRTLWPSLGFICTWTTAICAAHLAQLSRYLDGIDVIDAIYSATEGWMTVPLPDGGGNVLHPGAHVFEFIEEGREVAARHLMPPSALEPGGRYEVFLTTAMGLVRYRLHDVVRCTGFFNRSPLIAFDHKSAGIISLGLVAVSEAELVESLLAAGLDVEAHWRVGPCAAGDGLALYVDVGDVVARDALDRANAHLRSININYRIYTDNGTLQPLSCAALPAGRRPWSQTAAHAQAKPVLLLQVCPERHDGHAV